MRKSSSTSLVPAALLALLAACGGLTEPTSGALEDGVGEEAEGSASAAPANAPASPDEAPVLVAEDVGAPTALAVAGDRVVIATERTRLGASVVSAGGLFVVHKRLGPALLIAMDEHGARYGALAVDQTHAYVATSDARLLRVPLEGGATETLAELASPAVALDVSQTSAVAVTNAGVVVRIPLDGVGELETLAAVKGTPRALLVDEGGAVYVATEGAGASPRAGAIVKIAPGEAAPVVLRDLDTASCAMVRDGKDLVFSTGTSIARLSADGEAKPVTSGAFDSCAIAVDRESVWLASSRGRLLLAPATGGAPIELAQATRARSTAGSVGVDASHVYWLEGASVYRLATAAGRRR